MENLSNFGIKLELVVLIEIHLRFLSPASPLTLQELKGMVMQGETTH